MNETKALSSEVGCPLTFHLMDQSFRQNNLCCAEDPLHPSYSEKYISLCFWLVPLYELFIGLFIILTGPARRGRVPSTTQPLLPSLRGWVSSQNNWIAVLESLGSFPSCYIKAQRQLHLSAMTDLVTACPSLLPKCNQDHTGQRLRL